MRRIPAALLSLLALSVALRAQQGPDAPPAEPVVAPRQVTASAPLADHHAHLLSPAGARHLSAPVLPAIDLPAELAPLVAAMEAGWNDKVALAALLAEDCFVVTSRDPRWIHGRAAAADFLAGNFAGPYRIAPVACAVEASAGHVAGYFTRVLGDGSISVFGHVLLVLTKTDGGWRVSAETLTFPGPSTREPILAEQLVAQLDDAGIERAAVLSVAYWFGSPEAPSGADELEAVRKENDWTVEQVGRFPERLVAFCSVNPLKDYALQEIDRCAKLPRVRGLKLHFGNSWVDVHKPEHVEKLRQVFAAANERGLAIVVHLWTDPDYGRDEAQIFLEQILPAAPDVPVQIAHCAGGGPGYTDDALEVFAKAIASGDPRTKRLCFDIATVADGQSKEVLQKLAERIRQIGVGRFLYGTDMAPPAARQSWLTFRTTVPLTAEEFQTLAGNVAPYFR